MAATACTPCAAQTVYQCTGVHGEASYQSTPCAGSQGRQVVPPAPPPPPAASAPTESTPPIDDETPSPPPAAPTPELHQCVLATDGKTYVSSNGNPPGYYAPLAVVDVPTPLAQQYSAANNMGHARPNAAMISN